MGQPLPALAAHYLSACSCPSKEGFSTAHSTLAADPRASFDVSDLVHRECSSSALLRVRRKHIIDLNEHCARSYVCILRSQDLAPGANEECPDRTGK
jgi:hypothetical protein